MDFASPHLPSAAACSNPALCGLAPSQVFMGVLWHQALAMQGLGSRRLQTEMSSLRNRDYFSSVFLGAPNNL